MERETSGASSGLPAEVVRALGDGMAVLPMSRDKRPLVRWKAFQTRQPTRQELAAWRAEFGERIAGWARVTGAHAGVIVLDFDGQQGARWLADWALSPHVRTGSGGHHWIGRHPGWPVKTVNSVSSRVHRETYPGVDIRGDGGYSLICGYNERGGYAWLRDPLPDPLDVLPPEVRGFFGLDVPPAPPATVPPRPASAGERVPTETLLEYGLGLLGRGRGRNDAGFLMLLQLRNNGYSESEALCVGREFVSRCPPTNTKGEVVPYTERCFANSAHQVYSRPARDPWVKGYGRPGIPRVGEGPAANGRTPPDSPPAAGGGRAPRGGKRKSAADELGALAEEAEIFRTPEGDLYASFPNDGHRETHPLRTKGFRRWLASQFWEVHEKIPGSQAVQDAVDALAGRAQFGKAVLPVHLRVAALPGVHYLDLGNERWEAVRVEPGGWEVVTDPPVRFRRAEGMMPLPVPRPGGKLGDLQCLFNMESEEDWLLVVSWLCACLGPHQPYPVLCLHGEQGSAKSTTQRALRRLVDPNKADLRSIPREPRDLAIAANNSWILSLDNVSGLPGWLSDLLCRLSTGGGFSTRRLHTDEEEVIFEAKRPVVLNGIGDLATQSDLLDRSLPIVLPPITTRLTEAAFWAAYEALQPRLLGALLDAVSAGLGRLGETHLPRAPRMADFARWAAACEPALGAKPGQFLAAYGRSREEANAIAVEASPVANLLLALVREEGRWAGTAEDLLQRLETRSGFEFRKRPDWPGNGRALSALLNRSAPNLRACGVAVLRRHRGDSASRWIEIGPSPPELDIEVG